ncbi:MAG: peptide deformylase [Alphaproteobacteria bacterium]|nr:peptide deformylase [Alphaproteobacteria bacterium]
MAILKIARMGHPVLRRPADPVSDATAPEIRALAADMIETMRDASGAGLAAPQVHVPLRLVVFFVPPGRAEDPDDADDAAAGLTILCNPSIEPLDGAQADGWEGCLSVPGLRGVVPRWRRIRYRGLDLNGTSVDRVASGFHARVAQHEIDHLDGILYPQRMRDLSLLLFTEELRHGVPEGAPPLAGPPGAGDEEE